jgi:hypothetical protein
MTYNQIIETFINGNRQDAAKEINQNFGWYDFATKIEEDHTFSAEERLKILCSLIRINNR